MKWHDVATMQQLNVNAEAVDTRDAGSKLVDAGLKTQRSRLKNRVGQRVKGRIPVLSPGGQVGSSQVVLSLRLRLCYLYV